MLKVLPEVRPATELGVRWLEENRPTMSRRCLVHGDFRTGNFMINEQGLVGLLDWEFAHWGDPIEDIGGCVCEIGVLGVLTNRQAD